MLVTGLSLLSGVLMALCLPIAGACPLGWIGLAPLIYAASRRSWLGAFGLGWAAGFAYHALAFNWLYFTCRFAGMSMPASVLALAGAAAFLGVTWGAIAAASRWLGDRLPDWASPWVWAVSWTAIAVVCDQGTSRLPGDLLEYTQWRYLRLIQIAAFAGPHFLGFVIVLVNAALARLAEREGGPLARIAGGAALAAGVTLAGLSFVYGDQMFGYRLPGGQTARVEILQGDIPQYEKWDERFRDFVMQTYQDLFWRRHVVMPQLVVWPETSMPILVREGEVPNLAGLAAARTRAPQLVGAMVKPKSGPLINAIVAAGADGSYRGAYYKRELVPFGEYVPFERWLKPRIGRLNMLGGIAGGPAEQPFLETVFGPAAGSVCFEGVFPKWARRDAARGARLIVNLSNDGWYKATWGPYQHFQANVFRAIENRVTVIRAGNTGISAVIDPWGVILGRLDLGARGRLEVDVPVADPFPQRSFYARHGDWFGWLCLAVLIVLTATRLRPSESPAAEPSALPTANS